MKGTEESDIIRMGYWEERVSGKDVVFLEKATVCVRREGCFTQEVSPRMDEEKRGGM